jgi:hypothetical protein
VCLKESSVCLGSPVLVSWPPLPLWAALPAVVPSSCWLVLGAALVDFLVCALWGLLCLCFLSLLSLLLSVLLVPRSCPCLCGVLLVVRVCLAPVTSVLCLSKGFPGWPLLRSSESVFARNWRTICLELSCVCCSL